MLCPLELPAEAGRDSNPQPPDPEVSVVCAPGTPALAPPEINSGCGIFRERKEPPPSHREVHVHDLREQPPGARRDFGAQPNRGVRASHRMIRVIVTGPDRGKGESVWSRSRSTGSSRCSAKAAWAGSSWPGRRRAGWWRSRPSMNTSPPTRGSGSGSGARRSPRGPSPVRSPPRCWTRTPMPYGRGWRPSSVPGPPSRRPPTRSGRWARDRSPRWGRRSRRRWPASTGPGWSTAT